jgi:ribonuclease HII
MHSPAFLCDKLFMSQKLFDYDQRLRNKKQINSICGIDETGRGCWAGPLVAAAVIFNPNDFIDGVNDSKKLSDNLRKKLDKEIKSTCLGWGIAAISPSIIDEKGITFANKVAMEQAAMSAFKMSKLSVIDLYVIDQSPCKNLHPQIMMPKADSISASVAAASILAKNYRDEIIEELSAKHPEYKFNDHNGYINKLHVELVNKHGLLEDIHRKSFSVTGFNKPKQISMLEIMNDYTNN